MTRLDKIADIAERHIGEAGPTNTCMSNGLERWTAEAGLKTLDTNSVSEGIARAKDGYHGWSYHPGTDGLTRGHFGVWTHEALGGGQFEHVTCVTDTSGALWRGVGSGTPSQRVAMQPASGGYNPRTVLRGYLIPPVADVAVKVEAPKPAKGKSGDVYVVKRGDTLIKIARRHDTTWQQIRAANPRKGDTSTDFHILRPNLIIVGQKLHIP